MTATGNGPTLLSVGHGARPLEAFLDLLNGGEVRLLVDVRTAPGSRKHPHFGRESLAASLRESGVDYRWERALGGWRKPRPDSHHTGLRSAGFRGYADHMDTEEFAHALDRLIASGAERRTAFMCSESLWWRCHRRLLSDALLVRGCEVFHLMERGKLERHRLTRSARVVDARLVYDIEEGRQEQLRPERSAPRPRVMGRTARRPRRAPEEPTGPEP
jgi:uncharacterized protein (DUF488 family)